MTMLDRLSRFNYWPWAVPLLLATLLLIVSRYNFLLFHTLAELLAIGVAITMTVVAWNMYPFTNNSFLMYLGIGYFWVAIVDLFHAFAYKGLGIFPAITTPEPAIQLWLAARYLEAGILATAPWFLTHGLGREKGLLMVGGMAAAIALLFVGGLLPTVFIEGQGLTPFKVANEYAIIGVLVVAALLLWRKRNLVEPQILRMMFLSIALTICAELAFTFYVTIHGFSNLIGHIFKIFSFWLIFLATVQTTLEKPFLAMARNASTYDAVPDATIVVDNDGIIRQVNQAACQLAGRAATELIGLHCHELYHPTDASRAQCPVCQRIEHGESASVLELHARRSDRYYDYSLSPVKNSRALQGQVQTIRDITLRKQAERLLLESEQYNRTLFETSPIGLALCRMNGELVDVNPAFAAIVGRTIAEALKCSYWDLTPEKYRPQELAILEQLQQGGSYGPYDKEYRHKDGHLVPVRLNGMLLERGGETYIWSSVEDTTQQRNARQRLDFMAYHDPLTHTPNRLLFNDRLEHALHVASRSGEKVAVLFIDLDRFKNINDSLGHAMGDKLLQQVANSLRFLIREQDTLARLGGDEFVLLLEKVRDKGDVSAIAEKIMAVFETPFTIDGHSLYAPLSIGISLYPEHGKDGDTLIKNADAAMYHVKSSGRHSYHFYTSELTDSVTEKLLLENALRNALGNDELVLHYQPQYELGSGRLLGAEALIRWNHPSRGQLLPANFIEAMEESGLIIPIGRWVLTSACAQMRDWLAAGIAINTIAVNVSGLQFQRGNIVNAVKEALQETGLEPHHLELEITESIIITKPEAAIASLHELKSLGIMISIDDFGTGYSSLNQLKRMPVDKLKIDQSFVRDILHDKNDEAITCAVIALGQSMEMRVIAEGVENTEQRDLLLRHGCSEGQGYLYSKAIASNDFMALARSQGHTSNRAYA